jgi:hypothetical protein
MTTTTKTTSTVELANPVVTGGSTAAAVIKAGIELSTADLNDVAALASYGWAVETRYLGATDTKGTRVKAGFAGRAGSCQPTMKTIGWDYERTPMANHLAAGLAFLNGLGNGCREYKLTSVFNTANGYVFTFI